MFLKVPRKHVHRKEEEPPTKLGLMEVKICMDDEEEEEGNTDR